MRHARTLDVGLDVHQASIAVAYAPEARGPAVVCHGTIGTRQGDIDTRVRQRSSNATQLVFVSEAGPCGTWLSRDRSGTQRLGWVVAPTLVPKTAGDRVNTDRPDATQRARPPRSGELTPVSVPTVEAEAIRDLARARAEAIRDRQAAKNRLQAFRLRPDLQDEGRAAGASPDLAPVPRRAGAPGAALAAHARSPSPAAPRSAPGAVVRTPDRSCALGAAPRASSRGARRRHGRRTTAGTAVARRALSAGAGFARDPATVSRPLPRALGAAPPGQPEPRGARPGAPGARSQTAPRGQPATRWWWRAPSPGGRHLGHRPCGTQDARTSASTPGAPRSDRRSAPTMGRERPPRCGALRGGVKRRQATRGPRARQAPDGHTEGGSQPTAIRLITRRDDWRPLVRSSA